MSGRLFVIEGSDSSGKSTQLDLICDRLERNGTPFRKIVFPRYENQSSALVKMYLNGRFGNRPEDVNAYAASSFFAVDRYASYKADWGDFYESGGLVICHRYTTANAIHQAAKLKERERGAFLDWLFDFEYEKMGIPAPSSVIFLDMPPDIARGLMAERNRGRKADIHEADLFYLEKCYEISKLCAKKYGWITVSCTEDKRLLSKEDIHQKIFKIIQGEVSNA
jgi:dTMP kinase